MSGGNWGRYATLAIGGLLYALMFVSMGAHWSKEQAHADSYAKHSEASSTENIGSTCIGVEAGRYGECVAAQRQAQRDDKRAEYDLSAQLNMGSAAWWMVFVSALALVTTIIGVWFVKRTLDATLEAVKDTSEATAAMVRQNELTEQAQRPWIAIECFVDRIELSEGEAEIVARVEFKNIGKTAATPFGYGATIVTAPAVSAVLACSTQFAAYRLKMRPDAVAILPGEVATVLAKKRFTPRSGVSNSIVVVASALYPIKNVRRETEVAFILANTADAWAEIMVGDMLTGSGVIQNAKFRRFASGHTT